MRALLLPFSACPVSNAVRQDTSVDHAQCFLWLVHKLIQFQPQKRFKSLPVFLVGDGSGRYDSIFIMLTNPWPAKVSLVPHKQKTMLSNQPQGGALKARWWWVDDVELPQRTCFNMWFSLLKDIWEEMTSKAFEAGSLVPDTTVSHRPFH